jgi:hypothetical protein
MRPISMDGYVAVVSPYLPSSIVSQQALARIRTVAAKLPPCSLAGLELRLRDDRPEVDFFVRLPYATPRFDSSLVTDRVWQAAQRVCDEMSSPSGALHEQVRFLFLEFDLDAPPREIPIPALFFELHTHRSVSAGDLVAIASAVGPDCSRQDVSLEALGRCVSALPAGANVAHMAVMPSAATCRPSAGGTRRAPWHHSSTRSPRSPTRWSWWTSTSSRRFARRWAWSSTRGVNRTPCPGGTRCWTTS